MTFKAFYEKDLIPILQRLEKRRKWLVFLFVLAVVFFGLGVWLIAKAHLPLFAMLGWLPVLLYGAFLAYRMKNFKAEFKPAIIQPTLGFMKTPVSYTYNKRINKEVFLESRLFVTEGNYYEGEDYLEGKIGATKFEICELDVREPSRVRTKQVSIFRGVFLVAHLNRQTPCRLLVLPREKRPYLSRAIKAFIRQGGREIETTNTSKFVLFSDSRDVFEHKTMTKFYELVEAYSCQRGKLVYASAIGAQIYLAIDEPKDILEPAILQNNLGFEGISAYHTDLSQILELVRLTNQVFTGK